MTANKKSLAPTTQLRQALQKFEVDAPGAQLTFTARLGRENRWSQTYAARVFAEYKRFVYLAVTAPHPVTPSDEVDQAWHLHLAYTESYWTDLCGGLLQRPLHHGPTRGGQAEDDKFYDWYCRTLESYARTFGHAPPADIWPPPARRFAPEQHFSRLNTNAYWLIKKPRRQFHQSSWLTAALLAGGLLLAACDAASDGEGTWGLPEVLVIVALVIAFIRQAIKRHRNGSGCSDGGGCGSGCGSAESSGGDSGCGSSGCSGGGCGGGCGS